MKINRHKRELVIGIMLLFLGTSIVPGVSTNSQNGIAQNEQNTIPLLPTDSNNIIENHNPTYDNTPIEESSFNNIFYPIADTWIGEYSPTVNHGSDGSLLVSDKYGYTADYEANALLKFNLSQIPSGTSIIVASLYLHYFNYYDTNPVNRIISSHRITSDWQENSATWDLKPSYQATETANAFVPSSFGWMRWDVTLDVQDIINGISANYGWLIRDYKDPWNANSIPQQLYKSKEAAENRPYLEITSVSGPFNEPAWKFPVDYEVTSVSISTDGNYSAMGTGTTPGQNNGKIYYFQTKKATPEWSYNTYGFVHSVSLAADGNFLAAGTSSSSTNKLLFFSKNSATPLWTYTASSYINSVSISADGSYIAAGLKGGNILIFSKTSNTPIFTYTTGYSIGSIAISRDGWFTVAGNDDGVLFCFNQSALLWSYDTGSAIHSLSLSIYEYYIILGNDAGKIIVFYLEDNTPLWSYDTNSPVYTVSISADGEYMAAGNEAGYVKCFYRNNSTPLWSNNTNSAIHSVSVAANGEFITVGNDAGIAYLFQKDSNQPLWTSVVINNQPNKPNTPSGKTNGNIQTTYTYTSLSTDTNGDYLFYKFNWGDGVETSWLGPYASGITVSATHSWSKKGTYNIRVIAKDKYGATSEWSNPLPVTMPLDIDIYSISTWLKPRLFSINLIQDISLKNSINPEKNTQPYEETGLQETPSVQPNRNNQIEIQTNIVSNPLFIQRINSIAIAGDGYNIVVGGADNHIYLLHSWDEMIESVVDDNTYVNIIPITYAIIHDPNGDSSYAYLERFTENEIGFSISLDVERAITLKIMKNWCGQSTGYYQNLTLTTSYSNDVYINYRLSEQVSSQQLSDKELIGPGHGDIYWIEEWNIPYQIINLTLKLGDHIIFNRPLFKFGLIRQHTVFKSADTINRTYPEPWRTILLSLDIGNNNKIDSFENPFVDYIKYVNFEGGISYDYSEMISKTHSRSVSVSFEIKEAVARQFGFSYTPGPSGQAMISLTLTFGAQVTSKTTQGKVRGCTLYDAVSYGGNLDDISMLFYQDKIFGTLLFINDRNVSYTSGPHEYWTLKADTVAPTVNINQPLNGQQVQGTVWVIVTATDNDINKFYQIFIDGIEKINTSTQNDNFQWPWDTTVYPNGAHVIKAQVTDSSGNVGSDTHTVTVNNKYYRNLDQKIFSISNPTSIEHCLNIIQPP